MKFQFEHQQIKLYWYAAALIPLWVVVDSYLH